MVACPWQVQGWASTAMEVQFETYRAVAHGALHTNTVSAVSESDSPEVSTLKTLLVTQPM